MNIVRAQQWGFDSVAELIGARVRCIYNFFFFFSSYMTEFFTNFYQLLLCMQAEGILPEMQRASAAWCAPLQRLRALRLCD